MDHWMPSQSGKRPGGLRMNWNEHQVMLHLDMHPPVLDTSGLKQTFGETLPKSDRDIKKGTRFGGQWLNSLCSMYHTLRSGTTPMTLVTPEVLTGQHPVYELYPQSHFQYSVEAGRMCEPNNRLWYPAEFEISQLCLNPFTMWESPSFQHNSAAHPFSSQLPPKYGISKVDQPLNPEAEEWVPRDYIKDSVSDPSLLNKKTSDIESLNDKMNVNPKEPLDSCVSDLCEITDAEVYDVRLSGNSSSVDFQLTRLPHIEKKGFTDSSFGCHTPNEVEVAKPEKEKMSLNGSCHTVVPVPSDIENLPSIGDCLSYGHEFTETQNHDENMVSDTGTFSYTSVVGETVVSETDPGNTVGKTLQNKLTGTECIQQPIPRESSSHTRSTSESSITSVDIEFEDVVDRSSAPPDVFLLTKKSLPNTNINSKHCDDSESEETSDESEDSDSDWDDICEDDVGTEKSLPKISANSKYSYNILNYKDKCDDSESEDINDESEESDSDWDNIFEDGVVTEKSMPKTLSNPKYSGNILNYILKCDDLESEDTSDESEVSDSDWDNISEDGAGIIDFDDSWGILGPSLTTSKSTATYKVQLPEEDDNIESPVKPICDTVCDDDDDMVFIEVSLEEINKRWEREVEDNVMGNSERKVKFGKVTVHPMYVWVHASKMARRGHWEEYARDRERFRHRIATVEPLISSILQMDHREKVFLKLYGKGCSSN